MQARTTGILKPFLSGPDPIRVDLKCRLRQQRADRLEPRYTDKRINVGLRVTEHTIRGVTLYCHEAQVEVTGAPGQTSTEVKFIIVIVPALLLVNDKLRRNHVVGGI